MNQLTQLVKAPPSFSINRGMRPCPTLWLVRRYGMPRHHKQIDDQCRQPTSEFWAERMVAEDVGPFRVSGHRAAVELLRKSLDEVQNVDPVLYRELGSMGMLCVRWVRGHEGVLSNHSLGMAIDFTVAGVLDPYGDGLCQKGLIDLYRVMKQFGWYWGAGFRKEDSMHFEVSAKVVGDWIKRGVI